MSKKQVYCIPGMGARSKIFERISLPQSVQLHLLEWKIPNHNESLVDYALRFVKEIKHQKPILLGVSFGGIIAQEIAKLIDYDKIIIISSVKSRKEFPLWMQWVAKTQIHKIFPISLIEKKNILNFIPYVRKQQTHKKLFNQFISIRSEKYFRWAIDQIINWQQTQPLERSIHIHGSHDHVFPIEYIKNAIVVEKGTHIMIVHRFRWFNEHLPKLIEDKI